MRFKRDGGDMRCLSSEMSFQVVADDVERRVITEFVGLVLMWLELNQCLMFP